MKQDGNHLYLPLREGNILTRECALAPRILRHFPTEFLQNFCKDSMKDLICISFLLELYDYKKHRNAEFRMCSELPNLMQETFPRVKCNPNDTLIPKIMN